MIRRALGIAATAVALLAGARAEASIVVEGRTIEVIDMHLHPGRYAQVAEAGKPFLVESLPPFARLHAPALFDAILDPWRPHVGVRAQTTIAGVDHVVLYAVYTHETSGYFTNSQLEDVLLDPRNVAPDGEPWAWGFASVNFFDGYEAEAAERLAALSSFFAAHPKLFRGIKLAHAHQAVAFDDEKYLGVYDVAAKHGVPVLLHTGFSPFPNTKTDPRYYDPLGLEAVVTSYDGAHGMPRVEFVLSHVGQGDARARRHALELAEKHSNVFLEISALNRPLLLDEEGESVASGDPQYPAVLAAIKARGLVDRTLFATDGPQFPGMVQGYVEKMVSGMKTAGYDLDEIEAVMSGNFRRLYLGKKG